jgi:predicted DNA-binding transcriptional regulator YafY
MVTASPTQKPVTRPEGFDLDRYIESGEFQVPVGPMIQLKAKFSRTAAAHLVETPLHQDQIIDGIDADHVLVTATVRDTAELQWWLSAFGPLVEVREPLQLRRRMAESAALLKNVYSIPDCSCQNN